MQYQLYYPCPEEVKILLYEDGAALNIHESWFQALFERACRGIFRFSDKWSPALLMKCLNNTFHLQNIS